MNSLLNKTLIVCICAILTAASSAGCGEKNSQVSRPLLGTIVTITIAPGSADTPGDFNAAFGEIEQVQKKFSPYDPESDISKINSKAAGRPLKISGDVFSLIQRSVEISEITGGAFDITFASLGKTWDFSSHSKEKFTPPDDKTVKNLLQFVSYKNLKLDKKTGTIRLLKSRTQIGLGGIAKGYATGRAIDALRKRNVKGAIVACAGDIQVIGDNNGKPWRAGIQDPRGVSVLGAVDMRDGEAVSTSGDYERFRILDGRRYHHIIDPSTGYPSDSGLISATVFSYDPVLSDVYSTAFFVSGLEKTKRILVSMNHLAVVLVTADMKVYVSQSLKGRITFREGLKVEYF